MKNKLAKPFLKWAGGKTQLIEPINKAIPSHILATDFTYIEPFVGSGAVLFALLNQHKTLQKAVINDINADLINTYQIIATCPKELIELLEALQYDFHALVGKEEEKKLYYYAQRELYNQRKQSKVMQAALFIFLNKTCFNGLYRVNKNNLYNVPMGSYVKPLICDKENLLAVHVALQRVEIICGDFEQTIHYASPNTLFYFDPPYKPLNETANFTTYSPYEFGDNEQIRLKNFCLQLNLLGCDWILSNSDVKTTDENNLFFDDLYADFTIQRVDARRSINSNPEKRGLLKELLITNSVHSKTNVTI